MVITSSTTITVSPDLKFPSICLPRPWPFGSLRTVKTCSASSGFATALVMPTASEMGSAPSVIPPIASIARPSARIRSRTAAQPSLPIRFAPKGSSAVTRQSM